MKKQLVNTLTLSLIWLCSNLSITAQVDTEKNLMIDKTTAHNAPTPSGKSSSELPQLSKTDDICKRACKREKRLLQHTYINERDVLWEKRIWREINVGERINQHFGNVEQPLISILLAEAKSKHLTLYSPIDDKFSEIISFDEVQKMSGSYDTITVFDPDTYNDSSVIIYNEINPQDVVRYRIKEVWYFDSKLSRMNVRILGIAPIVNKYDEYGKLMASMPLFWIYYPDAREVLLEHKTLDPLNGSSYLTWDDVFEARLFNGLIVKESNIYDRRIQDYASGVNALLEAERIHEGIRNYEQDLWSY